MSAPYLPKSQPWQSGSRSIQIVVLSRPRRHRLCVAAVSELIRGGEITHGIL